MPDAIIDEHMLRRLYIEEKRTDLDIAKICNCTKTTVYRTRKKFHIEAIKQWERHVCEPTEQQLQMIYGSLLGDASISNGKKGKYDCESIFEVQHCAKQKEYTFWKYAELKNLCRSEPKEDKDGRWRVRSFHHPFFSGLRQQWYPEGKKSINRSLLDAIGTLGLAVWYMDDGHLGKASNFIKISTCSFTEYEHQVIIDWLKSVYGIASCMKIYSGYRILAIDVGSRKDFVQLVKPYIVDSMQYKATFREYHTWTNQVQAF